MCITQGILKIDLINKWVTNAINVKLLHKDVKGNSLERNSKTEKNLIFQEDKQTKKVKATYKQSITLKTIPMHIALEIKITKTILMNNQVWKSSKTINHQMENKIAHNILVLKKHKKVKKILRETQNLETLKILIS